MNILYTITWPEIGSKQVPKQIFEQIRSAVGQGLKFPFDCPYEVALVKADGADDNPQMVVILGVSTTPLLVGDCSSTLPQITDWLNHCLPTEVHLNGGVISARPATHLKIEPELGEGYQLIANFGTFVGEPDLKRPDPPPAVVGSAQVKVEGEKPRATPTAVSVPLKAPAAKAAARTPAISSTARSCITISLLVSGVLAIPISLVLGAVLALGEFSQDPTSTTATAPGSPGEFALILLCCPIPILVLGIGLILLGIYLPRWLKEA